MVSIRNQISMLNSVFSFYYGFFEEKGYSDINNMIKREFSGDGVTNIKEWLDYSRVIKEISNKLEVDKVKVLRYEDLSNNRSRFFEGMSDITGEKVENIRRIMEEAINYNVQPKKGESYTKPSKLYDLMSFFKARHLSKMKPVSEYPLGRSLKKVVSYFNKKVEMSNESIDIIRKEYGKSNRELFETYGLEGVSEYPT